MGLRLKFNLVLLVVFVLGLGVTGYLSYELLHRNARDEVLRNAGVMMEAALSMRGYTVGQVRPHLVYDPDKFLPQSVPAFGATEIMSLLRKKYPDYAYKEAALNPTNPRNRAVEWETDIVNAFRNDAGAARRSPACATRPPGRSLYLARPLQIKDEACLSCHTTAEMAPAAMVKIYGAEQRLRLEAERGDRRADRLGADGPADPQRQPRLRHLHELAGGGVRGAVRDPEHDADAAHRAADHAAVRGRRPDLEGPARRRRFSDKGSDEVSQLGQAFNRMRRSLEKAISLIDKG